MMKESTQHFQIEGVCDSTKELSSSTNGSVELLAQSVAQPPDITPANSVM